MRHSLFLLRTGILKFSAAMVLFLFAVNSANAQTNLVFDTAGNIVGHYVGAPSKAADWWYSGGRVATPAAGGGVTISTSGASVVKGIRVPVSVVATVSKASIVAGAIGCVSNPLSAIVCAATAIQVAKTMKEAGLGYGPCPPGSTTGYAFICKQAVAAGSPKEYPYMVNGGFYETGSAACAAAGGILWASGPPLMCRTGTAGPPANYSYPTFSRSSSGCSSYGNYIAVNGNCRPAGDFYPPANPELTTDLGTAVGADGTQAPKIWGAGRDDQGKSPRDYPDAANQAGPDTPVTVTAPPVVGPENVTGVQKTPKADGSIDTTTTKEQTTVTPTTTGTTHGTSTTTFPSTTTTTTTTTNNVTNITTSSSNVTNVVNNESVAPQSEKLVLPTDYNREATQQQILKTLDGTGMPDATTVDKDTDINTIKQKNDEFNTSIGQINESSVGLFDWFPRIPTATCQDPQVSNPLGGGSHTVPICNAVNTFSTFISAVLCFFCLIGSVRNVQDAMKA